MPLLPDFSMTKKDKKRFHKKYVKTDKCWNWTASRCKDGYGRFKLNGKMERAHKISLFLKTGKFYAGNDDLIACHSCKQNTRCVNPAHLDWDTLEKNAADKKRDGTENPPKGERSGSSKLTDAKVLEIRQKYPTGKYTQQKLAAEYGVEQQAISRIIRRERWNHI